MRGGYVVRFRVYGVGLRVVGGGSGGENYHTLLIFEEPNGGVRHFHQKSSCIT